MTPGSTPGYRSKNKKKSSLTYWYKAKKIIKKSCKAQHLEDKFLQCGKRKISKIYKCWNDFSIWKNHVQSVPRCETHFDLV